MIIVLSHDFILSHMHIGTGHIQNTRHTLLPIRNCHNSTRVTLACGGCNDQHRQCSIFTYNGKCGSGGIYFMQIQSYVDGDTQ